MNSQQERSSRYQGVEARECVSTSKSSFTRTKKSGSVRHEVLCNTLLWSAVNLPLQLVEAVTRGVPHVIFTSA
jgi:hypothetical protein